MSTSSRFGSAQLPNQDKTGRVATYDTQTPIFAATLTIVTTEFDTLVEPAVLTGAMTVNVGVGSSTTAPYKGDQLAFLFTSDATGRTVTLGTGMNVTAATIVIPASKKASIFFTFDGAAWVEGGRAITI